MLYERLHMTFVGVVAMLLDSVVVAEFAGHWLHRLLHCGKFPAGALCDLDEAELLSLRDCSKALFHKSHSRLWVKL
jgi:hypothetical protein